MVRLFFGDYRKRHRCKKWIPKNGNQISSLEQNCDERSLIHDFGVCVSTGNGPGVESTDGDVGVDRPRRRRRQGPAQPRRQHRVAPGAGDHGPAAVVLLDGVVGGLLARVVVVIVVVIDGGGGGNCCLVVVVVAQQQTAQSLLQSAQVPDVNQRAHHHWRRAQRPRVHLKREKEM